MGLAERKAMASFKKDYFQPKIDELRDASGGAPIEVTLDEASFTTVDSINMITSVFDRIVDDMKRICDDDVGKEAVRDGVKAFHIVHKDDKGFNLDLANGTLTLRAKMDGSLGEDVPGYGEYKDFLMKKL
jgi:hypothetical protein